MADTLVLGDLGHPGKPVVMPVKTPKNGERFPAQQDATKHLSGLRVAVERCIAHLTTWTILKEFLFITTSVPGKWWVAERPSEGIIGALEGAGQHNRLERSVPTS
jgi:hypothetical protein